MDDAAPDKPRPTNPLARLLALSGRAKLLIAVGVLLVLIFGTRSCQGVEVAESEAISTARSALAADPGAFEPATTEAKVLRQGFPPDPVWVVVFTIPDPQGGPEDFLHRAAIWVDAQNGQVRQVEVTGPDAG